MGPPRSSGPRRKSRRGDHCFGLCETCVHQQLVHTTRGSTFSLCRRSRTDPSYPRYPRVPVLACPGYESRCEPGGDGD